MRKKTVVACRRLVAGLAVSAAAAGLALGACGGRPVTVDGDLTDGWEGFAEPVTFTPEAGTCHQEAFRPVVTRVDYRPVDCDAPHLVETVHVGAFGGEPAGADQPPEEGSAPLRAAFRECEQAAADHLGADYRYGPLWLGVAIPLPEAWSGGARWYRCDLSQLESGMGDPVSRRGNLAGALADGSPLRLSCWTVEVAGGGEVTAESPVPCDQPHRAEFVGVWRAPDGPYPDPEAGVESVYDGCRSRIAAYTGVPDDGDVRYRVGTIVDWMSEQDWNAGDRGFRCRLLVAEPVTGSLQDAGPSALPVRTG